MTDNGNSTWTYDFTVWNHMATATTDAEMYLNKFGLTVADTPTQEVPADWSDGASWHHNDPVGGGNWYGQLDGGEEDPDDLTLPVVWDSAWIGRIREGDALNGFRITLPALVPSFTWQAYASGYESVWPGLPAGPSKRSSFGAWFDALRPEVGGVSEEYWEYAWNGTVVPT